MANVFRCESRFIGGAIDELSLNYRCRWKLSSALTLSASIGSGIFLFLTGRRLVMYRLWV